MAPRREAAAHAAIALLLSSCDERECGNADGCGIGHRHVASGCTSYQQSRKVAVGGGITSGAGAMVGLVGLFVAVSTIGEGAASLRCGDSTICPIAARVGVLSVLAVPIGAIIAVAGLAGMGMGGINDKSDAPTPPPQDRFWCQRDSGICTNDQASCGPDCLDAKSIWCAPYKTVADGQPGLLCGLSSDACFVLAISDHNRRGRESFGDCALRTEQLPPPRREPPTP